MAKTKDIDTQIGVLFFAAGYGLLVLVMVNEILKTFIPDAPNIRLAIMAILFMFLGWLHRRSGDRTSARPDATVA